MGRQFDHFSYPIILVAFAILCLIDGAYKIVLRNCNHEEEELALDQTMKIAWITNINAFFYSINIMKALFPHLKMNY